MSRRIRIILSVAALAVTSVFTVHFASAQTVPDAATARCTLAVTRLSAQVERVESVRDKRETTYTTLQTRLAAVTTRAESNGYDVGAMTAAQTKLRSNIATFDENLETYYQSLAALSETECATEGSGFVASLLATREALADLQTSSVAVRTTVREDVLPTVRDYATWLREQAETREAL